MPKRPDDDELNLEAPEDPGERRARPVAVGRSATTPVEDERAPEDAEPEDAAPEDEEAAPGSGPTRSAQAAAEPFAWTGPGEAAPAEATEEIERPLWEIAVGVLGAVLAVLVFTPWYTSAGIEASGWSSGAWGPVVFGIGLAAVAIVVLRRLNVPIRFPIHHALVLEGLGWAAVAGALVKLVWAPRLASTEMGATWWLRGTLIVALGLALAGGSVSQGVALVVRPGWWGERAGKVGAGVLAAALALGGAFGALNDVEVAGLTGSPPETPAFEQGYPACAENAGVPVPDGIDPVQGTPSQGLCVVQLRSRFGGGKILNRYERAFTAGDWSITFDSRRGEAAAALAQIQARKGTDCASVSVHPRAEGVKVSSITIIIGPPESYCDLGAKLEQQQQQQGAP